MIYHRHHHRHHHYYYYYNYYNDYYQERNITNYETEYNRCIRKAFTLPPGPCFFYGKHVY